jgi:anaerobic magnesium-protoporphyrin IX monomethyl ester cyclase
MIVLFHPRATKPKNRRFPLSVLALAAVLEGREEYVIVAGNLDSDPSGTILLLLKTHSVELLAVAVMPGPQMVAAIDACKSVRALYPRVPIVWGGYFPSVYPDAALNAAYVDFVVRGQGEDTLLELIEALREKRALESVRGLSFKAKDGSHRHNQERGIKPPDAFPWHPYHRLPVERYILPSFFGKRTAVHQASVGCPFRCSFCAIGPAFSNQEKMEAPASTEAILRFLATQYAVDSIQFYDMNFFLREERALELAERIAPLGLRWWCEARIDIVGSYSDKTLEAIRRAGCTMIFFGAESGSDWVLKEMNKQLTTGQTLELAARIKQFDIIPEFSFVVGNPKDPQRDAEECLSFIRKIKRVNPASEIIIQHYTPVPQRDRMYGDVEDQVHFPATPEEWATPRWLNFTLRIDPANPWMSPSTKNLIDNFELVVASRWPTVQDIRLPVWSRRLLQFLSSWRYATRFYASPFELRWAQQWVELRKPKMESL